MNLPNSAADGAVILRKIRLVLGLFILALILSGITAFPLGHELEVIAKIRGLERASAADVSGGFDRWIVTVRDGLRESYARYPWLAYGTDWLAFAHIAIAVSFIGPFLDPVRNVWIFQAGIIACIMVVPLALICGSLRQIPFGWRLIDCSFGIFGAIPLSYCFSLTRTLEKHRAKQ
jgi:hypothetical protein